MKRIITNLMLLCFGLSIISACTSGPFIKETSSTADKTEKTQAADINKTPGVPGPSSMTTEASSGNSTAGTSDSSASSDASESEKASDGNRWAVFRNLKFEIPLDWIEEKATDYQNVYYVNNAGIYVGYEKGLGDVNDKVVRDYLFKVSMQNVEYSNMSEEEEITFNGHKGYRHTFTYKYEDKEYDSEYIMFGNKDETADIFYTELKELKMKNKPVLKHLLETVKFIEGM